MAIWRDAPYARVERGDEADVADAGAVGGEEQRHEAPGEAVVEVVDQAGLRAGAQRRARGRWPARTPRAAAVACVVGAGVVAGLLERDVGGRVAHEQDREQEAR